MANDIFISYRRSDQRHAELLHRLLKERGVDSWYDALLGAGEDWRSRTAQALVDAPIFVLLFSKNAAQSDDIVKELSAATFQKKTVIPVRIEDIHPEGAFLYELASRNWFDAFNNTEARLALLADQLVGLVHGGSEAKAAAAKLGAAVPLPPKKKAKGRGGVILGVVGIIAAAVVAIVWMGIAGPDGDTGSGTSKKARNYRTAFFGITATGDDPVVVSAANTATEEAFRLLELMNVDTVPRADTVGDDADDQDESPLDRADGLNARFALTGEIRREGDTLKSVVRMVDVSTRQTIAQMTGEGSAARPGPVAYPVGARVARLPNCVQSYAASDKGGAPDAEALALIGRVCATDLNGAATSYRELTLKRPKNWMAAGALAEALVWRVAQLPQAQRPAALSEAEAEVKRAEEMAPDAYSTAIAHMALAVVRNRPAAEWLPQMETLLARGSSAAEAVTYARGAAFTGQQLLEVGRIADASRYFALAVTSDPTASNWEYYLAVARAASSQYGAKETLDRLIQTRVVGYSWEVALAAAIFLKATDPEAVIAAAPADAMDAVPCYRDLMASLKETGKAARLAGAKHADTCLTSFDSPHVNILAQAALGDLDRAFAIADRPDFTAYMWNYWAPMFLPPAKAMRADARFLPLAEKLGYLDYWKQTKTQPDVCGTPEERDIPLCKALRGG